MTDRHPIDGREVLCVTCGRSVRRDQAVFFRIEEDGCGEYECLDRRACILARQEKAA